MSESESIKYTNDLLIMLSLVWCGDCDFTELFKAKCQPIVARYLLIRLIVVFTLLCSAVSCN